MTSQNEQIIMYGTRWCYDTTRARRWLENHQILYTYIDIDDDHDARSIVEKLNNGMRSVPTIVFPDGSILVEPSTMELANKFGL